jgi:hypothetical protein
MPAAGSRPKKQPKARKPVKELMSDEHGKESEKRASRCEAVKITRTRLDWRSTG